MHRTALWPVGPFLRHYFVPNLAKYTHRSSFSEFAFKYSKDERFKSVEKMREREQLFTDYLTELKKVSKHKEEQKSSKSKEDMVNLYSVQILL